jgi:diguanylate cyclase (GGDEF)-like protein
MTAKDVSARITAYKTAVRAMREGRFDWEMPDAVGDEVGKLGEELSLLAKALERKFDEIGKLQQIAEEVSAGLFLDDVLSRVYATFRPLIPFDRIGCALLSDDCRTATAHWVKSDRPGQKIGRGYSAPVAASSLQQVLETGRPRILNDLEAYLAEHPDSVSTRLIVAEGVRSSLTCPLIALGKPVGFLFFSSREKNTYRNMHQGIFLHIAGQLSALIEKSRLYQQLFELNQRLLLAERELKQQATHDALTGVFNRGAINEMLQSELARAQRSERALGVIMVDVDNFKQVNDSQGHLAGDHALRAVAARLRSGLRGYDHIGRFGGEEFLIVLGEANFKSASETAERLRLAVSAEPVPCGDRRVTVTISAGVAVVEQTAAINLDQIIAAADEALYEAKRHGRNRVAARRI